MNTIDLTHIQLRHTLTTAKMLLGLILIVNVSAVSATPKGFNHHGHKHDKSCLITKAPTTLANLDIILQVENAVSDSLSADSPYKGAIVKHFNSDGTFTALSTATTQDQTQQASNGTYTYSRTGQNTAIEKSLDATASLSLSTIKYTFESKTRGSWKGYSGNEQEQASTSGSFTIVSSNLPIEQH